MAKYDDHCSWQLPIKCQINMTYSRDFVLLGYHFPLIAQKPKIVREKVGQVSREHGSGLASSS